MKITSIKQGNSLLREFKRRQYIAVFIDILFNIPLCLLLLLYILFWVQPTFMNYKVYYLIFSIIIFATSVIYLINYSVVKRGKFFSSILVGYLNDSKSMLFTTPFLFFNETSVPSASLIKVKEYKKFILGRNRSVIVCKSISNKKNMYIIEGFSGNDILDNFSINNSLQSNLK